MNPIIKPEKIQRLYKKLLSSTPNDFPAKRESIKLTNRHGVYIIYGPKNEVLHVGKSARGKNGLRQRIKNHLHGASSFAIQYVSKKNIDLRKKCCFKYLEVENTRERAYLENLASGMLCPRHIGTSEKKSD